MANATTTIRLDADDRALIDALKKDVGTKKTAQLLRMGLRCLAKQRGIKLR
jgi:hypothetical protein